jgi:hypothetical protein
MDENVEGKKKGAPHVSWPRDGGSCPNHKAGAMILLEILERKPLFALLRQIDADLSETTRANRCPSVGGLCITRPISVRLVEDLRILMSLTRPASVFAAAGRAVGVECCRRRSCSGAGEFIGRL